MMPYAVVVVGAVILLTIRYLRSPRPSARSKWVVGGLTIATLGAPYVWSASGLVALPLQFVMCVYLIFDELVRTPGAKTD
jgi:hypothetical protein